MKPNQLRSSHKSVLSNIKVEWPFLVGFQSQFIEQYPVYSFRGLVNLRAIKVFKHPVGPWRRGLYVEKMRKRLVCRLASLITWQWQLRQLKTQFEEALYQAKRRHELSMKSTQNILEFKLVQQTIEQDLARLTDIKTQTEETPKRFQMIDNKWNYWEENVKKATKHRQMVVQSTDTQLRSRYP